MWLTFAKLPPCSLGFCSRLGSGPICTLWKPHSNVPLNLVCPQKEIVKMRYLRSCSVCTRKCAHLTIHLLPSLRFGCSLLSNLGWCLRKMRALHPHICLWLTSHMDVKRSWWFFLCKHWNVERISNSIHSYPCFSIFIHCYPVLSCTSTTRVSHPGNQADCGRASVSLGLLASTKCCQLSTKDGLQAY